jgi:hypothetical protein
MLELQLYGRYERERDEREKERIGERGREARKIWK